MFYGRQSVAKSPSINPEQIDRETRESRRTGQEPPSYRAWRHDDKQNERHPGADGYSSANCLGLVMSGRDLIVGETRLASLVCISTIYPCSKAKKSILAVIERTSRMRASGRTCRDRSARRTGPMRKEAAVRPPAASRPIEASKDAVCYVRLTSTRRSLR